jgi:hypothetical protein
VQEPALEPAGARVQAEGVKVPPAPPSLQVTVPDGDDGEEPVSVTVAEKVIEVPATTDEGFGETAAEVGCGGRGLTVRDDVPELAVCEESPE